MSLYVRTFGNTNVGGNRKMTASNFKRFDKMETNLRTDKSIKGLWSFSTEIFVQCPNCNKRAVVLTELGKNSVPYPSSTKSKFCCNNCYKPINQNLWYGPIYISPKYQRCDYCGTTLQFAKKVNKLKNKIELKCPTCKQEKRYDVSYSLTYANNKQATDPYFGFQLWLQIPVHDNIFWAYNYEHLEYLKKYVAAKLREERVMTKYSMTQKLPDFIKLAKNRDRILKAIVRLEKL
jgi:hypothetical protein